MGLIKKIGLGDDPAHDGNPQSLARCCRWRAHRHLCLLHSDETEEPIWTGS
jgi:hypothetical protein